MAMRNIHQMNFKLHRSALASGTIWRAERFSPARPGQWHTGRCTGSCFYSSTSQRRRWRHPPLQPTTATCSSRSRSSPTRAPRRCRLAPLPSPTGSQAPDCAASVQRWVRTLAVASQGLQTGLLQWLSCQRSMALQRCAAAEAGSTIVVPSTLPGIWLHSRGQLGMSSPDSSHTHFCP